MKNLIFTIITISVFSVGINAQKMSEKVYPGYVVLESYDTLHGTIEMLSPAMNEIKVNFRNKNDKQKYLNANEIVAYAFKVKAYNKATESREEKWINYTRQRVEVSPVPFGPKNVLVYTVVQGKVSFYNHYIERTAKLDLVQYVQKDGEMISITKSNYANVLREMMSDYPELYNRIGSRGHGFKSVDNIVEEYNQWMDNNTEEVAWGLSEKK